MVNKLKNALIILGMVGMVAYWLMTVDGTDSYSGSMHILSQNGVVTMIDDNLHYEDFNDSMSSDELRALNTLTDHYLITYEVMFADGEIEIGTYNK